MSCALFLLISYIIPCAYLLAFMRKNKHLNDGRFGKVIGYMGSFLPAANLVIASMLAILMYANTRRFF